METTNNTARIGRKAGQGSKWIRPNKRLAIYLRDGIRRQTRKSLKAHKVAAKAIMTTRNAKSASAAIY